MPNKTPRIIVIGAGVGGLTAACLLAEAGYGVTVLEAQTYPGGCASTFFHKGYRFDSGATVVGGFQPNGPHTILGERLNINWPIRQYDPAWITHLPGQSIALTANNADVIRAFPKSASFWQQQHRLAAIAWKLSAQGLPWPPQSLSELGKLLDTGLRNLPIDLQVVPFAIMTAYQWLRLHGLHNNSRFVRFLDAQLLISAQITTHHANALYAATALDLARQGVYHIEGGIGNIAQTLVKKLEGFGGRILYRHRATKLHVTNGRIQAVDVQTGRRSIQTETMPCEFCVANTTPWNLDQLLKDDSPSGLRQEVTRRKPGWGAFVVHLGVDSIAFPADFADHHQVITTEDGPLGETHSIFMSLSPIWDHSRAPEGKRALTITTHTHVSQWGQLLDTNQDKYMQQKRIYTDKILNAVETVAPNIRDHIELILPGSPVTYQYYTERHLGMVGGFPQTSLFQARGPRTGIANLRLVGDSIFPGQSTAGVTLGAIRVSEDVQRGLRELTLFPEVRRMDHQP